MWWSKQADGSELSGEFSGELARRDKTASTPPVGMSPSESAHSEPDQCACPPRGAGVGPGTHPCLAAARVKHRILAGYERLPPPQRRPDWRPPRLCEERRHDLRRIGSQ